MDKRCSFLFTTATLGLALALPGYARMGEGIMFADITVHPYIEGRIISDSNVFLDADDEEEDVGFAGQVGIRADRQGEAMGLDLHGYFYAEDYIDANDADDEDYGVEADIRLGDPESLELDIKPSYRQTDETDRETGRIEGREILDIDLGLIRNLTDKLRGEAGYQYEDTDYDEDDLFDRSQNTFRGTLQQDLTEKTALFVTGSFEQQESDGAGEDSDVVHVQGGIDYRITEKLSARLGGGWRDHSESDLGEFSYDASAVWRASDNVQVALNTRNRVVPSAQEEDNFNLQNLVDLAVIADMTDTVTLTLRGSLLTNELDKDVAVGDDFEKRDSDTYTLSLRIDYAAVSEAVDVFGEVAYEERTSSLDDEYDQLLALVGITLTY